MNKNLVDSTGTQRAEEKGMELAINHIRTYAAKLGVAIDQLYQRLDPLLTSPHPEACGSGEGKGNEMAEIPRQIIIVGDEVRSSAGRINDILRRLDI